MIWEEVSLRLCCQLGFCRVSHCAQWSSTNRKRLSRSTSEGTISGVSQRTGSRTRPHTSSSTRFVTPAEALKHLRSGSQSSLRASCRSKSSMFWIDSTSLGRGQTGNLTAVDIVGNSANISRSLLESMGSIWREERTARHDIWRDAQCNSLA